VWYDDCVSDDDVPTGVDFHNPVHARTWTEETPIKRPHRVQFFAAFCAALRGERLRVLELGSGPGHLARKILLGCDVAEYVALDFSEPMHALAREHLAELAPRVTFVTRDFRDPTWAQGIEPVDAIVTMQAAHETRHVRHLVPLLASARTVLRPGGVLLYCDHYVIEGRNPALLPEREEQPLALRAAGFAEIELLLEMEAMALYAAR
jgi:SAM-dependent methyltransferase